MKSGISISKINEMINESLTSAGGNEWKLFQTVVGTNKMSIPDNYKEILITSFRSHTDFVSVIIQKNTIDMIIPTDSTSYSQFCAFGTSSFGNGYGILYLYGDKKIYISKIATSNVTDYHTTKLYYR